MVECSLKSGTRILQKQFRTVTNILLLTVFALCTLAIGGAAHAQNTPAAQPKPAPPPKTAAPTTPPKTAAPAAPPKGVKATTDKAVTTSDGWTIHFTYFQPAAGREAPVVILLHMRGGNRLVWGTSEQAGFATQLQDAGYAAIAVDLRKHGESKQGAGGKRADGDLTGFDYVGMVNGDLEAVKGFIYEEHQLQHLNMNKTAIVGAEMSAPVALNFALADWNRAPHNDGPTFESSTPRGQDVRAIVLLSPEQNLPRLPTPKVITSLRSPAWNIAFLVAAGTQDQFDGGQSRKVFRQLTGVPESKSRMYLETFNYNVRGTDLLGKKEIPVEELMMKFLDMHLKHAPGAWHDRRSRFQREPAAK
jgi:pimeloyl-ACP methyl ester carboxylesterase